VEVLNLLCGRKGKDMIPCTNIKCPHYQRAEKRDWIEKQIGVTNKQGTCKYNYCKIGKKKKFF